MTHHPFRDATINVYQLIEGNSSPFTAKIDDAPIVFKGSTADIARAAAEKFRDDAIEKNEAAFIKRQAGLEKARATRKAKAGAK